MFKKNLILSSLLLFISCASKHRDEVHELKIPDIKIDAADPSLSRIGGMLYHNGEVLFGKLIEIYTDGQLKSLTEYFSGKKNGKSGSWYSDGQKRSARFYKNGRKESEHKGWWPNGELKFTYHFVKGFHNGKFLEWYDNRQLAKVFNYEKGKEVGEQKAWRVNGKLYINLVIKNGKRYGLFKSKLCFTVKAGEAQTSAGD